MDARVGRARIRFLALPMVGLLVAGVGCRQTRDEEPIRNDDLKTFTSGATNDIAATTSAQESSLKDLEKDTNQYRPLEGVTPAVGGLPGSLAIGSLEDSRLLAVDIGYLVKSATQGAGEKFEVLRASPVVGAANVVHQVGNDLIIASTNHAELVRMRSDWQHVDTLALADLLDSKGLTDYWAIVERNGTLLVTVGFDVKVAIVEVDPVRWTVKRHRIYSDRFNAPPACMTPDGQLALTSRSLPEDPEDRVTLDFIDPASLDRRRSVLLPPGWMVDLACIDDTVWIADGTSPSGPIFGTNGEQLGRFKWAGKGSLTTEVLYSAPHGRLFGSDPVAGRVFSCDIKTRACRTSGFIGGKPTDVLPISNKLFVALETAQSIAVLDAASLKILGKARFPGSPRTLTLLK